MRDSAGWTENCPAARTEGWRDDLQHPRCGSTVQRSGGRLPALPGAPRGECNAVNGGVGSPSEMPILPRPSSRESPDSVAAEELLNGRGAGSGAPAGQQALARVLAVASGPASDSELAGQAAAMAAFAAATGPAVQPASPASTAPRSGNDVRCVSHLATRLVVAAAACVTALGGAAAYASALPAPLQELAHATFGAPAPRPAVPLPSCHQHVARRPGPSARTRAPPARPPEGPPELAGRAIRPPVTGSPIEAARPARRPTSPVRTSTGRVRGAARPTRPVRPAARTFLDPAHEFATAARSGTGFRRSFRAPQAPHAARGHRPDGRLCQLYDGGRHRDARRARGAVHLVGCASSAILPPPGKPGPRVGIHCPRSAGPIPPGPALHRRCRSRYPHRPPVSRPRQQPGPSPSASPDPSASAPGGSASAPAGSSPSVTNPAGRTPPGLNRTRTPKPSPSRHAGAS